MSGNIRVPATCIWCRSPFMARKDSRRLYCSAHCSSSARRPRFNGGLCFDKSARRWRIMCRDGTQLWFYRGVVAAHIGRLLRPDEIVHHRNEDTTDDRIENLLVTTRSEHVRIHARGSR